MNCDLNNDLLEQKLLLLLLYKNRRRRRTQSISEGPCKSKVLVRQIFSQREKLGEYHRLIQELKLPTGALKKVFLGI